MQELIDCIEQNQPKNKTTNGIWSKAKSLLEKEKEQIMDAYYDGRQNGFQERAEQYYNETYKKE